MDAIGRVEYAMGAFLLRLGMGLLFFIAGLGKMLGGMAAFRQGLFEQFGQTWLPALLYVPFGHVLPFAELILGALLILGLMRRWTLGLTGLLMVSLAFGMMLRQQSAVVSSNLLYVGLLVANLFATPWDRWTADRLISRKRRPNPIASE